MPAVEMSLRFDKTQIPLAGELERIQPLVAFKSLTFFD